MNLFDYDRQRTYFERSNQRLQTKISFDIKREKIEEIRRIQVKFFFYLNKNNNNNIFLGTNKYDATNLILFFKSCSS